MALFRIYKMKDSSRQQFRWAPHTAGSCQVKLKDYEDAGEIEEQGFYAAWSALRAGPRPLEVGDLLERGGQELRICKYIGFEEARWLEPEIKTTASDAATPMVMPA